MDAESAFRSTVEHLASADVHLSRIIDDHGHPRRFTRPATFQTLILLILEQQVSLDSARAAYDRLDALIPGVEAGALAALTDQQLRDVGFSRQKTRYSRELARRVIDGRLDPAALAARSDDEVRSELTAVPGIGPWTADVFLMSSLGRADIWPTGDRALQVATSEALQLVAPPEPAVLAEIGERWRPHRTAAAQILWHGYLSTRNRTIPGSM
ncbi:MAG: DNA-3-methyladenine glycosylase 2 family protein [Acidimicrobiia bacterium]|nr:DNA-3-methyladenine glycosylase 2 family protein [Acidimicrobiia bacterium]